MYKTDNDLFFTCSLIEYIARETKNRRSDVVNTLGDDLRRIYEYADIFHCEPIAKVADDFISRANIKNGDFDNISACKYTVPDYWDIGDVFSRLILDCGSSSDVVTNIKEIYNSWITDNLMNYNSDLYYQPRDYLKACYNAGEILDE